MEGVNLHFGGCQFTILEAEIVLGVLYRKGVIPKKGGTLDSRDKLHRNTEEPLSLEEGMGFRCPRKV